MLFAPGGRSRKGASNVLLVDGEHIVTPALTDSFLTASLATRAPPRPSRRLEGGGTELSVDECVEWIARPQAELALTGTAAVVAAVGTLVVDGVAHQVGATGRSPRTDQLRAALRDIQTGRTAFEW